MNRFCFLKFSLLVFLCAGSVLASPKPRPAVEKDRAHQVESLDALWSVYKYHYIESGRVVSHDEHGITTSEGQGYALLRAVWSGDRATFDRVWAWTQENLQVRSDKLFAWKWKDHVLDLHSATDADTDVALALLLASNRFANSDYRDEARKILDDLWRKEILQIDQQYFVTAGDWAKEERFPTIHVAYMAPYAYELFAQADGRHPWRRLIDSTYALWRWIYFDKELKLPPEIVYLNPKTGRFLLQHPLSGKTSGFSYDAFPLFWREALDAQWYGHGDSKLRQAMLRFFQREWLLKERLQDRYTVQGQALSNFEGLPLYATVQALATLENESFAQSLRHHKLDPLWANALASRQTSYYLHNWLWFGRALDNGVTRRFDEFLGFLRPIDLSGFFGHFPWKPFGVMVVLFLLAGRLRLARWAFLAIAFTLAFRYIHWRLFHSLNFIEPAGPYISISLWAVEFYFFLTVVFFVIQVGFGRSRPLVMKNSKGFSPSVDVYIPIYSESLAILEKTLVAATAMPYKNKTVYVLDDSHRDEVKRLATQYDASYIQGPRQHAKAGNLNHALSQTSGEFVAVFDTDHIPMTTFLQETIPFFSDARVGFVQTPHHFYNQDIFQRATHAGAEVPNEQDMFHHGIQARRDAWGGAFFVGSGAVFRRQAIESVHGFNLLSITEDIHTSQHLHAAGWRSVFVNKTLLVGLSAENLASYMVQRRRWMLGCLQIFFKDNPLFCHGLPWRHRLGYLASLTYFFFPLGRIVLWATPLYFLLFHWHPMLADVSVMVAYMLPYLIALPMISMVLLPGWPRLLWGALYELAVTAPLVRSMADLVLPTELAFAVTPKGVLSDRRAFDLSSSWMTLIVAAISLFAIGKGLFEFFLFGIERDAYFFNLTWAGIGLFALLGALLVAWERPQCRREIRVRTPFPFKLKNGKWSLDGQTADISLSGVSIASTTDVSLPTKASITLGQETPVSCDVRLVYHERLARNQYQAGYQFIELDKKGWRTLVLEVFASPKTWERSSGERSRSTAGMLRHLLMGLWCTFQSLQRRRRFHPRHGKIRKVTLRSEKERRTAFLLNHSEEGRGILGFGLFPAPGDAWTLQEKSHSGKGHCVYSYRVLPGLWRAGIKLNHE